MGLRISEGTALLVYYALVNTSGEDVDGASLRISIDWRPATEERYSTPHGFVPRRSHPTYRYRRWRSSITEVVPLVLNADPDPAGAREFDIPPGRSETSAEFTIPTGGWWEWLLVDATQFV